MMVERMGISWFSRVQNVTSAASSEWEYVALADMVNVLRFLRHVEGFMMPLVETSTKIQKEKK